MPFMVYFWLTRIGPDDSLLMKRGGPLFGVYLVVGCHNLYFFYMKWCFSLDRVQPIRYVLRRGQCKKVCIG